jgi:hypothetical protein
MTATQNETRKAMQRRLLTEALEAQLARLEELSTTSSDALCDISVTPHINSAWRSISFALNALTD